MTDRTPGRPERPDDVQAIPQGKRTGPPPPHRGTSTGRGRAAPTRPMRSRPASAQSDWLGEEATAVLPDAPASTGASPYAATAATAPLASGREAASTAARPLPVRTPTARPEPSVALPAGSAAPSGVPPGAVPPTAPPPLPPRPERAGSRRHRLRTVIVCLVLLGLAWLGAETWAVRSSWASVGRVATEPPGGHIGDTAGRNTLMVGSDARSGLTPEERKKLGTGSTEGARTDSIMVLHTGDGDPTLLSIPRDSYVEIPGYGMNKINAAFALGGPPLLSATVEKATGLRMDGYVEIGFGGFAGLVDAVGGVRMCLKAPMQDEKAHIDLPAGCQTLDGKNALGYVRARYSDPEGDLGRVKRQREFLGALMGKIATPSTALLPWKLHSVGTAAGSSVAVGEDDSMRETAGAFLGLRAVSGGAGASVTVPVADAAVPTPAGTAVTWDSAKAQLLFQQLRDDQPVTLP